MILEKLTYRKKITTRFNALGYNTQREMSEAVNENEHNFKMFLRFPDATPRVKEKVESFLKRHDVGMDKS